MSDHKSHDPTSSSTELPSPNSSFCYARGCPLTHRSGCGERDRVILEARVYATCPTFCCCHTGIYDLSCVIWFMFSCFAIIIILNHGGIRYLRLASLATELLESLHPRCATRTQASVHATHHVQTKTDSSAALAHAHCVQVIFRNTRKPIFAWGTVTLADT